MHDDNNRPPLADAPRRYIACDDMRDDLLAIVRERDTSHEDDGWSSFDNVTMYTSNDGHGSSIVVRTSTGQTLRIIVTEVA